MNTSSSSSSSLPFIVVQPVANLISYVVTKSKTCSFATEKQHKVEKCLFVFFSLLHDKKNCMLSERKKFQVKKNVEQLRLRTENRRKIVMCVKCYNEHIVKITHQEKKNKLVQKE